MKTRTAVRDCKDAVALLSDYLEGDLTADAVERLAAHLALCGACEDFLKTLRTTRDAVRGLAAQTVPEDCRRELRARLESSRRKSAPRTPARRGRNPARRRS